MCDWQLTTEQLGFCGELDQSRSKKKINGIFYHCKNFSGLAALAEDCSASV